MLEDANSANDLALLKYPLLALGCLAGTEVARVADDLLSLDGLVATANSNKLAVGVGDNLVDSLVQHVGTTVDSRETCERLGKLSQAVEGVNVWRLAVPRHGRGVEDDTLVCRASRFGLVPAVRVKNGTGRRIDTLLLVSQVQSHSVSDEVLGSGLKAKLLVDLLHSILVKVDT